MKFFTIIALIAFSLSACHKDEKEKCTFDGSQSLTLFNGFAYAVDVKGNRQEGLETFGYIIQPGKKFTFTVRSGHWNVLAHWDDGMGPFAHNSGDFDKTSFEINDCDSVEIDYPF